MNSVFHAIGGPESYFTTSEKAIWRNLATWAFGDDEWIELPGPADWWPEDEAIDSTGFYFLEPNPGYRQALELVLASKYPNDGSYERVLASDDTLLLT